jgi:hypothetical protein
MSQQQTISSGEAANRLAIRELIYQASVREPVVSGRVHPSREPHRRVFGLRVRCKQIATIRMPPEINTRSPMLKSPSHAWSASKGRRVFDVAACHTGLAG